MRIQFPSLLLLTFCLGMSSTSALDVQDKDLNEIAAADEGHLRVHFIDVGGGMAALVETPNGRHVLIDGGKKGKSRFKKYVEHFVPDKEIDVLIVTHADHDHYGNLNKFIDSYEVNNYINTGYQSFKLSRIKAWKEFRTKTLKKLKDKGTQDWTPMEDYVSAGQYEVIDDNGTPTEADDVTIHYLNVDKMPPQKYDTENNTKRKFSESERRNNASLVFKIEYGRFIPFYWRYQWPHQGTCK